MTLIDDASEQLYELLSIVHTKNELGVVKSVKTNTVQLKPIVSLRFEAIQCTGGYCMSTGEVISRAELRERFNLGNC